MTVLFFNLFLHYTLHIFQVVKIIGGIDMGARLPCQPPFPQDRRLGGGGGGLVSSKFVCPPTKTQGPPVPPYWKKPSYATAMEAQSGLCSWVKIWQISVLFIEKKNTSSPGFEFIVDYFTSLHMWYVEIHFIEKHIMQIHDKYIVYIVLYNVFIMVNYIIFSMIMFIKLAIIPHKY